MLVIRRYCFGTVLILLSFFCLTLLSFAAQGPDTTNMAILVDRSGSMRGTGGDPQGLSRAAVEFLLDQLELASDENKCALVLFSSNVKVIPENGLTNDFEKLRSELNMLSKIGGNTDLEEALNRGLQLLSKSSGRKQMVLISDGKPEPDFKSTRAPERFPLLFERWRKARSESRRRAILEKLSEISTNRIKTLLLDVLRENKVELYPVALTGIQANGEELLRKMAIEVTQDVNAFKKADAVDLIKVLDSIVPKPIGLMNILRTTLREADLNQWEADFNLDSYLKKVRVLILYERTSSDVKWVLEGATGIGISRDHPNGARYAAARDRNGDGKIIYERIFLDNPAPGHYKLMFSSPKFIPPLRVIVEGRTDLRLAITASPLPAEVGIPVTFFCRTVGTTSLNLTSAEGALLNENGLYAKQKLLFSPKSQNVVSSRWVPRTSGRYRLRLKAYLDKEKNRYLSGEYSILVRPKQAVKLYIEIPVRQ